RAFSRREQKDSEDRLAVDFLVPLADLDRRLEARRGVHELGRRARVQAELVLDLDFFGDHCVVTARRSDATLIALAPFSVMTWASEGTSHASRWMVANFTIIGRFTPVTISTRSRSRKERLMLLGVPPNMSVKMMAPSVPRRSSA